MTDTRDDIVIVIRLNMKIVVLDGYGMNPGDLSWAALEAVGEVTVYPRTRPEHLLERAIKADALLTNKVVNMRDKHSCIQHGQRGADDICAYT